MIYLLDDLGNPLTDLSDNKIYADFSETPPDTTTQEVGTYSIVTGRVIHTRFIEY